MPWETWNQQFLTKMTRTKNTRFNQILCHELKEINPFVFPSQILCWKDHVWSGRMAELLTLYVVYLLCLFMFVFDSVKSSTIKLDKTQKGGPRTRVIKQRLIVSWRWGSGVDPRQVGTKYQWETHVRHTTIRLSGLWLVSPAPSSPLIGCWQSMSDSCNPNSCML